VDTALDKDIKLELHKIKAAASFKGTKGSSYQFTTSSGLTVLLCGLGEKSDFTFEALRRATAAITKTAIKNYTKIAIKFDGFVVKNHVEESVHALTEAFYLTAYSFDKYLSKKSNPKLKTVFLESSQKASAAQKINAAI